MADLNTNLQSFLPFLNAGLKLTFGAGSPLNVVVAPVGSLYLRTDGGAATTLYVKESGTDSSGWVAK